MGETKKKNVWNVLFMFISIKTYLNVKIYFKNDEVSYSSFYYTFPK